MDQVQPFKQAKPPTAWSKLKFVPYSFVIRFRCSCLTLKKCFKKDVFACLLFCAVLNWPQFATHSSSSSFVILFVWIKLQKFLCSSITLPPPPSPSAFMLAQLRPLEQHTPLLAFSFPLILMVDHPKCLKRWNTLQPSEPWLFFVLKNFVGTSFCRKFFFVEKQ